MIGDQSSTLRLANTSHDLARVKKMRDRLLLDLGLGGPQAVQHQNVRDLNHLLQAPGHYMGLNMFAANPTFDRIGSRISLDMLKSMHRVSVFSTLQSLKPKNPKERKP